MTSSSDHKKREMAFPGKDPEEKVHLVIRRHWIVYLTHLIISLLILIVPAGFFIGIARFFPQFFVFPYLQITLLFLSLYYLFAATQFMVSFSNYYFDVWIITSKRLIAIEQKTLFNRVISELSLYNIQDVTIESKGILATFLHFGTLFVQTAGKKHRFVFEMTPKIQEVKETLNDLVEKASREEKIEEAQARKQTPMANDQIPSSK